MKTNAEARAMVTAITDPDVLNRVIWVKAVQAAEDLGDLNTRERAELLRDGFMGYNDMTAENLAEELFPEDDDDDGDDFHEQTLERVEAAIADKEWD